MKRKNKVKIAVALSLFIVMLTFSVNVSAADESSATLTPSTASGMLNLPTQFKATGLVAATVYSVELNDATYATNLIASTSGELSFSVTPSLAGYNKVELINSTSDVVATATINATDLVALIVPMIIMLVSITLIFSIVKEIKV